MAGTAESRFPNGFTRCGIKRFKRVFAFGFDKCKGKGNFGDCEPVGEGVIEIRVHIGPGYRVYCGRHGKAVVLLLSGGDKSSQARGIKRAKALWSEWKRRQR